MLISPNRISYVQTVTHLRGQKTGKGSDAFSCPDSGNDQGFVVSLRSITSRFGRRIEEYQRDVTDTSGSIIPGVAISVKNPATGLAQNTTSSSAGTYSFQGLPAGQYNVGVESQGFRKAEVTNITVTVNTNTKADVRLEVGAVQETVEVQGVTTLLQTDRSDLGKVIDKRAIESLPLFSNGAVRSNLAFATLVPGANLSVGTDPDSGFSISGGTSNGNSMLVDGGEHMSERRNDPQMRVISADGIEEFKVQTSAYGGRTGVLPTAS